MDQGSKCFASKCFGIIAERDGDGDADQTIQSGNGFVQGRILRRHGSGFVAFISERKVTLILAESGFHSLKDLFPDRNRAGCLRNDLIRIPGEGIGRIFRSFFVFRVKKRQRIHHLLQRAAVIYGRVRHGKRCGRKERCRPFHGRLCGKELLKGIIKGKGERHLRSRNGSRHIASPVNGKLIGSSGGRKLCADLFRAFAGHISSTDCCMEAEMAVKVHAACDIDDSCADKESNQYADDDLLCLHFPGALFAGALCLFTGLCRIAVILIIFISVVILINVAVFIEFCSVYGVLGLVFVILMESCKMNVIRILF